MQPTVYTLEFRKSNVTYVEVIRKILGVVDFDIKGSFLVYRTREAKGGIINIENIEIVFTEDKD